ncbi:MAG: lysylphosphatidylglycerol synthase transmembrane domain-containing protein [bacterium]|nr:lysylphosphatidylglycerol synthase transmembrane domain-containing protein [bacterium]
MKKWFWIVIKILISILLLGYLFYSIDFIELQTSLANTHWGYIILALCIYIGGQILNSYKWALLIETKAIEIPFSKVVGYYFMGMYFNLFLPSIVGGDIPRGYYLYKDYGSGSKSEPDTPGLTIVESLSTVMMQRVTGVFALIIIASITYFFFFYHHPVLEIATRTYLTSVFIFLLAGTVLGIAVMLKFKPKIVDKSRFPWIHEAPKGPSGTETKSQFKIFLNDIGSYLHYPKLFSYVILLSFVFQLLNIFVNIIIGAALHVTTVPLSYYYVAMPIIALLAAIPISFNGMGVREGAYVFFLGLVGIDESVAFSFALLWLFIVIVSSLLGGPLFIFWKNR